jgi:hypothetical protein
MTGPVCICLSSDMTLSGLIAAVANSLKFASLEVPIVRILLVENDPDVRPLLEHILLGETLPETSSRRGRPSRVALSWAI